MYDKLQESENASAAYIEYVTDNESSQVGDKSEVSQAYKYLANYYIKRNQVDEAYKYAHKCLDFEEVRWVFSGKMDNFDKICLLTLFYFYKLLDERRGQSSFEGGGSNEKPG